MSAEGWRRVKELFHAASELDPERRRGFLQEACAGDAQLMEEVQSLLASGDVAPGFIEEPAVALVASSMPFGETVLTTPERIGPYQIVDMIGRGGMGTVYRAVRVDGEYSKTVAIKVVRQGMDSDYLLRRFLSERQILANLDHRNIARLLDGGATDGGLPYIVMEYVEGTPIDKHCDQARLPTRERLRLFLHVCSAVDFAHRNLVVHRDLKPSNILVTGDGVPKLLDFGIAKLLSPDPSLTSAEQTVTAMRMMTPEFASPEQVRGEAATTATDVYSLGVVLYMLLTGHRPYRVTSGAPEELVRAVCETEPEKPSTVITRAVVERRGDATVEITPEAVSRTRDGDPKRLRRALRGDLDNILLMAMQKEPERRYGSVSALADDIGRYLQGEPVHAHAATWRYLLGKKVSKHRWAVAGTTLAVLAIFALGGLWLRTRWETLRKVQVAQEFAQEVERNESMLRSAYLAPLHDTRQERARVRQWVENTRRRVQRMGDASRMLGEYALGVGLLSLDDCQGARTHLEAAWQSGYRSPDAACALGLALVRLYDEEKKQVDAIRSPELRDARRARLLSVYRDPALKYLHDGAGASIVPREYVEGLIAYLENRYDECLEKSHAAMNRVPWFYQAKILEGDVYLSRGNQKRDAGDRDGAMRDYETADQTYRLAARVGESDPLTYARIANVWKIAMFSELYGSGKDMSLNRQRALDAASDALKADPENADVHVLIANVCRLWSTSEVRSGRNPGEWLARSFESARAALRYWPMHAEAHAVIGVTHQLAAQFAMEHGENPAPSFTQAIEELERARQLAPNHDSAIMNLANCYWALGEYQLSHGQDPRHALGEGIRNLERAIELFPGFANLYNNLGNCRQDIGLWEMAHGVDPMASFAAAVDAHTKALQLNPKHTYADGNLGNDYACRAQYKMSRGQDPADDFRLARKQYEASLLLTPGDPFDLINMGDALVAQARFEIWTGADPSATIREAMQRLGAAAESRPDFGLVYTTMSGAYLNAAQYDLDKGRSPHPALEKARACAEKGLALDSTAGTSFKAVADVDLLEARWRIQRGQSPTLPLARARQRLEKSAALEPNDASYPCALAEMRRFQAEWNIRQKAMAAARRDLSEGIELARRALAINTNLAEGAAAIGILSLLQARIEPDPSRRRDLALTAQQSIEKALSLNEYLQREYAAPLEEARVVASR